MNRLTDIYLGNTHSHIVYDPLGRMTDKQADGQTVFANASFAGAPVPPRPHALKSAESPDGIFPAARQDITYTSFDKVKTIAEGSNTLAYTYGYDRQRIFMEEHANGIVRTKRYVGGCEFVTLTENNTTTEKTLTYLSSPIGIFAVMETVGNDENLHYILKDHLGSWTTITDCQGNIEQELSFDAWGNRRNPETWHSYSQLPEPMFDRGFTGHEHLYAFGLINMNGRMYDPLMSSFLSVDAYVQSPDNSQNFNRYAYCLNNPLKYVDPTGWRMEGGYMGNTTQGPSGWGKNLYPVYEPRDLGLLQLPEYNELAWWREGNKMDGGGSVTIGGNGNPTARVVTDAGHGIRGKNDKYMDHGACNGEYYESDFALLIEHSLSKWLIAFGISTERTRENEIVVNDNRINYRWKLANEAGAEVFISIHLDFDAKETAFAVYEQRGPNQKWQEENSIELANYIMQNMTIVLPADESIIPSTKTNHGTIGVLKCFKGEAGVLLEMGGIGSEANRNNIINNHDMIGRQIATGVYQYLNDGALPPSRLSWFYKCTFY